MIKLYALFDSFRKLAAGKEITFSCGEPYNDVTCNDSKFRVEFYKAMIKTYGYDKFPQIVNPTQYRNAGELELYHGFRAYSHGYDYLSKEDIFDHGWIPSGFYVTAHKTYAYYYTAGYRDEFPDSMKRVLRVKLATNKICHFNDIKNMRKLFVQGRFTEMPAEKLPQMLKLKCFVEKIDNPKERETFTNLLLENFSNLAIFLGYDAMYGGFAGYDEEDESSPEEIEVLNRGIAVVKDSQYIYFKNRAKLEAEQGTVVADEYE